MSMEEAGRRGSRSLAGANSSCSIKCGRWNPTAEQVRVLMDLFRAGLRTPSTDQIQWISSHLSTLGKIESKNVFYWFQNHKARERLHHSLIHTNRRRRLPPLPPPPALPSSSSSSSSSAVAAGVWTNSEEEVPKRSEEMIVKTKKTLELFPLTSSSPSFNFGFDFGLVNYERQFREDASRSGSDQSRSVVSEEDVTKLDLTVGASKSSCPQHSD